MSSSSSSSTKNDSHKNSGDGEAIKQTSSSSKSKSSNGTSDSELFSVLSAMHLTNHVPLQQSRKRKILDHGGHGIGGSGGSTSGGKYTLKPPALRRSSEEEDLPLHTPQCSQSGYADDEDRHHSLLELNPDTDGHGSVHPNSPVPSGSGNRVRNMSLSVLVGGAGSGGGVGAHHPLMSDIDENLAADFDGSFSGLGVDINSSNYSMSEALMALPNLSISNGHIFKHENQINVFKQEEPSISPKNGNLKESESNKNLEALDLSNDEAHFPDNDTSSCQSVNRNKTTFAGSVSRESSCDANITSNNGAGGNLSGSHPNLPLAGNEEAVRKSKKIILPLQTTPVTVKSEKSKFQCILAAQTSNATKLNEPSITYLNQGQAYELRLKKLGDLSGSGRPLLFCKVRICFHERRLQYMEMEQMEEWKSKHPGERVLDLDIPLSYGIMDPCFGPHFDPTQINSLSFKWDPTRDTGAFIKVNCISTEFTPKKHGGEKGVPFRLQVETYEDDVRVHAASCILQVFKLRGADRKHKQDREKISKRPVAEQEKYTPSYDCTVLVDVAPENVYVPNKKAASVSAPPAAVTAVAEKPEVSPLPVSSKKVSRDSSPEVAIPQQTLSATSSPDFVMSWMTRNRFDSYVTHFRNFNGRDLLRLTRDDVISLCGLSDGIRLYNEVHMVPVGPAATFYVTPKGALEYSALFLEEHTVVEFVRRLSSSVGLPSTIFGRLYLLGPHGILVRVTDDVVCYTKPETVFQFTLRPSSTENNPNNNICDIILEDVTPVQNSYVESGSGDVSYSINGKT